MRLLSSRPAAASSGLRRFADRLYGARTGSVIAGNAADKRAERIAFRPDPAMADQAVLRGTRLVIERRVEQGMGQGERRAENLVLLRALCETMRFGSRGAPGGFVPFPVIGALTHFPEDFGAARAPAAAVAA